MVQLMLCDAVQQVSEIVAFAGTAIPQSRVGKRGDCFYEFIVRPLRVRDSFAPCAFGSPYNRRKIIRSRGLALLSS